MEITIILGGSTLFHLQVKYSSYAVAAENVKDNYFLYLPREHVLGTC